MAILPHFYHAELGYYLIITVYRRLRGTSCYLAATMKKMLSRHDGEEDAILGRLMFRTFQMHVTLPTIDRFQRYSSQIKVEDKRFNLI